MFDVKQQKSSSVKRGSCLETKGVSQNSLAEERPNLPRACNHELQSLELTVLSPVFREALSSLFFAAYLPHPCLPFQSNILGFGACLSTSALVSHDLLFYTSSRQISLGKSIPAPGRELVFDPAFPPSKQVCPEQMVAP